MTCLFNVDTDPCEQTDLSNTEEGKAKVRELDELAAVFRKTSVEPLAMKSPLAPRSYPENWNGTWLNWMDYVKDVEVTEEEKSGGDDGGNKDGNEDGDTNVQSGSG